MTRAFWSVQLVLALALWAQGRPAHRIVALDRLEGSVAVLVPDDAPMTDWTVPAASLPGAHEGAIYRASRVPGGWTFTLLADEAVRRLQAHTTAPRRDQ